MTAVTIYLAILSACLAAALAAVTLYHSRYKKRFEMARRFDTRTSMIVDWDVEEKIRMSKKQLETTFDAIADLICVIDSSLNIARVNKSYADKTGFSVKELPGRKCYTAFFGRTEECDNCPARSTIKNGQASKKKFVKQHIGDDDRLFEISTFAVTDAHNHVVNVIEHIRDVTQEKRMNEQLLRAEKLAGIGIMTAGIAHEMNNPLSGISGTAVNLLKTPEKYGLNGKGADRVSIILDCATRATMIMKDLLRFSQKQDTVRIPTDFALLITKAIGSVKPPGSSKIKRILDVPQNLPHARCDPAKIEQVIVNLASNAVQAILERRKECGDNKPLPNEEITVSARHIQNELCIDVIDNGIGISPDVESMIFDPFFTTRAPGEGTGLGLSVCHRIIEEHQGSVRVFSVNGHTTARVTIPVGTDPFEDAGRRNKGGSNV